MQTQLTRVGNVLENPRASRSRRGCRHIRDFGVFVRHRIIGSRHLADERRYGLLRQTQWFNQNVSLDTNGKFAARMDRR